MKTQDMLLYGGLAFVAYKLFLEPKKTTTVTQYPGNTGVYYNPYQYQQQQQQNGGAAAIITAGTPLVSDIIKLIMGGSNSSAAQVNTGGSYVPLYGSGGYSFLDAGTGSYLAGIDYAMHG